MKKLTALICLMLCVMVGAVYASWTYATQNADDVEKTIGITVDKTVLDCGSIELLQPSTDIDVEPSFVIEESSYASRVAVLNWTDSQMQITFTADAAATTDVKTNGIDVKCTFELVGFEDILMLTENNIVISLNATATDLVFTGTLDLATYIVLDPTFSLETVEEYDAFQAALASKSIKLTISQYIP